MTNHIKQATLNDPAASNWLKKALVDLDDRDIVDALNDAEYLVIYLNHKLNDIQAANEVLLNAR